MENLDYVKLAVSKDETRFNLCSVYRDKNHFVATDGHRLHMSNGLPDAPPAYLNGNTDQFPDYNQVIPKGSPIGEALCVSSYAGKTEKDLLAKIKSMKNTLTKFTREKTILVDLVLTDGKTPSIAFNQKQNEKIAINFDLPGFSYTGQTITLGVNLDYFIDAISFIPEKSCRMHIFGELAPIRISSVDYENKENGLTAIVMPVRREK